MSIETLELTERMRYKPDGQIMISADHQLRLALSHWLRKALERGWEPLTPRIQYTDQWICVKGGCETDPEPIPEHAIEEALRAHRTDFVYRTRQCDAPAAITFAQKVHAKELKAC